MKRFLRLKLVVSLAAFMMIAAAIVVPLSWNIIGLHTTTTAARAQHQLLVQRKHPRSAHMPLFLGSAPQSSANASNCLAPPAHCDLTWHNGPVQEQPVAYAIFWGKSWPTKKGLNATGTIAEKYLQDIGGSNYANILSQYYDSNSHISKNISFGGLWMDPSNPPFDKTCTSQTVQDSAIQSEVSKAISGQHWSQGDINATFIVYTPSGFSVNDGSCSSSRPGGYCGYHSMFGTNVVYSEILFPTPGCLVKSLQKGENVNGQSLADVTAHEQFEAATDPDLSNPAWQDVNGNIGEIGDKCNFDVSKGFAKLSNKGSFEVQTEYSNVTHTCVNSYTPGNIWLTGHDADYHCSSIELAQCNYLKIATTSVRGSSTLPLLVLDHGGEVSTALSNAFLASLNIQVVDPRSGFASVALVDATGKPLYSAIIVASDVSCGGCDNNDDVGITPDSDAINARADAIAQFFSAGGGILALAGADNTTPYYQFLPTPFAVTGIAVTAPFVFTAFGLSLGLIEGVPGDHSSDDNCCATHNSFSVAFVVPTSVSYKSVELDSAGAAETLLFQGH